MSDRIALVTGAGRDRIGRAVAVELASAGFDIVAHYFHSHAGVQETIARVKAGGRNAVSMRANLANESSIDRMIERLLSQFGRLDVLVCTAALFESAKLEKTSLKELTRQWTVNTAGTFLCCRLAGLAMAGQKDGGAIVVLGDWAIVRPYRDYAAYLVSKGAIPTLVRTMAVELAERNPSVRVNGILPGPVMLPESMTGAERKKVIEATLVKREGRPEHVAHAVRFLVENDFITGVCLPVDGGRRIYAGGW